jgi:hypothetical protein
MNLTSSQLKKLEEISGLKIDNQSNIDLIASLYLDLCDPLIIAQIEASNLEAQNLSIQNKSKPISNVRILNPYELENMETDSMMESN